MASNFQKPIFITARFRSGSTLLWNIFRHTSGCHAYYEPLHEQLPELINLNIAPQARHYFVDTYFKQYPDLEDLKQFHSLEFGVNRLFLEKQEEHPDLKKYINYLLSYPQNNNAIVFQFNRIDFRLPWIRENFPNATLIHLYRSPRDQWISTIEGYPTDIDKNIDCDPYRITTWSRDLIRQFPFLATPHIRHPYQRYYYLWKLSYLMGNRLSDFSISYEDILSKPKKSLRILLAAGQLDTQENIEKCLNIIVRRPVNIWKKYRSKNWFEELEQECENQLTSLGLNQFFGIQTLNKIIASNAQYKKLIADHDPVTWAIKSGQDAVVELLNAADDKERVIQEQKKAIHDQVLVIKRTSRSLKMQGREINKLYKTLGERENIINNFQNLHGFWLQNGPFRHSRTLGFAVNLIRAVRGFFLSKLGVLAQHPPKQLEIPNAYRQSTEPTQELPVISIVTPSYNQAKFIERTIQSVLGQKYPKLEYVIQDGKSTDHTNRIVKGYKDQLTHFESRQDNGQAHAINLGFEHTGGEIMAYMNSDDILLPGALNYVAKYFQKHPEVDALYSHRIIVDEQDREVGRWLMPKHDNKILYWADYVPQETLFWRRRVWEKAGGKMDETFKFALDWDLLLRFQMSGAVIHRVPRFLAAFRIHVEQKTSAHINVVGLEEMQRIRRQYLGRDVTDAEIFKNIKGYLNRSIIYHKLYRLGVYKA